MFSCWESGFDPRERLIADHSSWTTRVLPARRATEVARIAATTRRVIGAAHQWPRATRGGFQPRSLNVRLSVSLPVSPFPFMVRGRGRAEPRVRRYRPPHPRVIIHVGVYHTFAYESNDSSCESEISRTGA